MNRTDSSRLACPDHYYGILWTRQELKGDPG